MYICKIHLQAFAACIMELWIWFVINRLKHWKPLLWCFNVSVQAEREREQKWGWERRGKNIHKFVDVNSHCLTGEEIIFALIVFGNGIERCERLWADDNHWPSSCQRGEAKRGQKAFSQLQTSAWCRRHQSSATDTSSEKSWGGGRGGRDAGGMMVYLFAFLYLLSYHSPPPPARASCQWEHAEALHSVTQH